MRLYVARHGQTQWNLEDKVCGSTDLPLTDRGLEQAEALAKIVAALKPDVIIASTMLRARQTAQPSAEACGLPLLTDERIREQDFGTFEGVARLDPEFRALRRNYMYRFPGGESTVQVIHRVYSLLDELRVRYPEKTVLLVCHGSVSRAIRTYFVSMTNEMYSGYYQGNGELAAYECEGSDGPCRELVATD